MNLVSNLKGEQSDSGGEDETPVTIKKKGVISSSIFNDQTPKKEFESMIVPHEEIRKTQIPTSVWLATYDELMSNDKLLGIISKVKNKSIPIEWSSCHLNGFKLIFGENVRIAKSSSSCLLKLFLLNKNQIADIIKEYYKIDIGLIELDSLSKLFT